MTASLEEIQSKVTPFMEKVKAGEYNTKNGLSYLDAKHLLLLFYCQSVAFYILLKANGRSVKDHPVIARLIEIRLFLEKIRPIDKKLQYQIEKLLRLASGAYSGTDNEPGAAVPDDLLYKPNPDMLVTKIDESSMSKDDIYRPPMFAPVAMDEEKISKDKRSEMRARKDALRKASRSSLVKELASELEGRPEEIREFVGHESKEMSRELARLEARARQEEDLFARVPLSKMEKKRIKHLKKSRNGLMGMLDDFDDDISYLVNAEESKHGGVLSHEPHSSISQADIHLRKPKKTTKFKKAGGNMKFKSGKARK
ncbi:hypothetical protein KP509_38G064600 [Ceratopteris richardii]|nr:hypothetical protein KP509_38G064600 [Ceratopteris richardii]